MSDTLGSLVDKLQIVNLKMFNIQEILYKIRKMNLEDFKINYFNEKGIEELFNTLNKATNLNVQRTNLVDEIDKKIIEICEASRDGKSLEEFLQLKHKTY